MKQILLSTFTFLPFLALAQKPFVVNGNVKGLKNNDKIYLNYKVEGQDVSDSANVINGKFVFKGALAQPQEARIFLNKNPLISRPILGERIDMISFYIEPGTIKLNSLDSLKNITITGSIVLSHLSSKKILDD